jgi:hypothetical protein
MAPRDAKLMRHVQYALCCQYVFRGCPSRMLAPLLPTERYASSGTRLLSVCTV